MFRTLDRYVLREVLVAWLAVTGVLLVILVSNQLARILGMAAANGFPQEVVLALIGLTSLQYLTVLVPVATLLAVMMALGRLYHESEMAAVRACGMGPERLYLPVLAFAGVVAVGLSWLSFDFAPAAYARALELRQTSAAERFVRVLTGDNAQRVAAFATEAGQFQKRGVPAVICGPGSIEQAHQPDEFVAISELEKGLAIFSRLMGVLRG